MARSPEEPSNSCADPGRVGPSESQPVGSKGKGINRIPVRFALMSAVFTTLGIGLHQAAFHNLVDEAGMASLALFAAMICAPALVTYVAAGRLAGSIKALRHSTEEILAGRFDEPVNVDCACEVGGLADSFRAMVTRLNSNILRMNLLAYTDPVTALPNRLVISHVLELASADKGRDCRGGILFLDLDGFKRVNDALGHEAGDELLRLASRRIYEDGLNLDLGAMETCTSPLGELRQSCPKTPVLARFAGDEFVLLVPGRGEPDDLRVIAERILLALQDPFVIDGSEVRVGASIGLAQMPQDTTDPDELLRFADLAMYAAKSGGKNRVVHFTPALAQAASDRTLLEADLRRAIAEDALELHFQPKLDAQTLELRGVEALARWRHPARGAIPPNLFVGLAERAGLIGALGACVFRMAAAQCRAWMDAGRPRRIAVNASPAQFESPDFVAELAATINAYGVDPNLMEIEITESLLISDTPDMRRRVSEVRALGLQISIDDFGTGFSNLAQLANLPVGELKIDRSLLLAADQNAKSRAILSAIVTMAHGLDLKVVAEGVESWRQLASLQSLGCDEVQGFLFSAALPAAAFDEWEEGRWNNPALDVQRAPKRFAGRARAV